MRSSSFIMIISFFLTALSFVNINIAFENNKILNGRNKIFNEIHDEIMVKTKDRYTASDAARDKSELINRISKKKN